MVVQNTDPEAFWHKCSI